MLKGLDNKYAIFCVSDPLVCTLDTSIGPFAFINTFVAAQKLIFLPLEHFHRLAEETGSPFRNGLDVVMIHMTARCGSTLLGMIIKNKNQTPGVELNYACKILHNNSY